MVGRVLCPMIVLPTWAILDGCPTKAKLWLISKIISKDKANNSLQCSLASKQFHKATIQQTHTQKFDTHSRATPTSKLRSLQ